MTRPHPLVAKLRAIQKAPNWLRWSKDKPPPHAWVVPGLVQEGEIGWINGPGAAGKTFFGMYMGLAIATGTPFAGYGTPSIRKVAYFILERGENSCKRRAHYITAAYAPAKPGDLAAFDERIDANLRAFPMMGDTFDLIRLSQRGRWRVNRKAVSRLVLFLKEFGYEVVFFDTLSRLEPEAEGDNKTAAALMKALERLIKQVSDEAQKSFTVMVVHHTGKGGRDGQYSGRGASALMDNASVGIGVRVLDQEGRNDSGITELLKEGEQSAEIVLVTHDKCSDGPRVDDRYYVRNPKTGVLRFINFKPRGIEGYKDQFMAWIRSTTDPTPTKFRQAGIVSQRDAAAMLLQAEKLGWIVKALKPDGTPKRIGKAHVYAASDGPRTPAVVGAPVRTNARQRTNGSLVQRSAPTRTNAPTAKRGRTNANGRARK